MFQQGCYRYLENDRFQAVSLPYGSGRVSMVVLLPKPGISIVRFQRSLTKDDWRRWMLDFVEMEGELTLPRFTVEYGLDLLPCLKSVAGDVIASTDFHGMGVGPLYISNVIHKTFLEVNEEGTEAAAATAIVMLRGIVHRFSMTVDRPFFLRDPRRGHGAASIHGVGPGSIPRLARVLRLAGPLPRRGCGGCGLSDSSLTAR